MRMTIKGKERRGYGKGTYSDYKPYITTSEFASKGTTAVVIDWKTKRPVHLLSQAELHFYMLLRWDDNNVDIREQFPMDNDKYIEAAKSLGFVVRPKADHVHTTDFLVTKADGSMHAYSIKFNRNMSKEVLRKLAIEKAYWLREGIEFTLCFKSDVESFVPHNIRKIVECYDEKNVFDKYSKVLHEIAHKRIHFDVYSEPLTKAIVSMFIKDDKNG